MKSTAIITSLLLFIGGVYLSSYQTDSRLGVMLTYETGIESTGLGINAAIPMIARFTLPPSFTYYFPQENYFTKDMNGWKINANANYYLPHTDDLGLYGLAGVNYSCISVDYSAHQSLADTSDGALGVNVGVGAPLNSNFAAVAETKYIIVEKGQFVIATGVINML